MIEGYLRQSPLAHLGLAGRSRDDGAPAQVHLAERPFFGLVNLRGPGADPAFQEAFETAAGYALPSKAGTSAGKANTTALWLGPREWAIVDPRGDADAGPRIAATLRAALADFPAAVTDIGESRACIRISGAKARATLQKGCPMDLHPRAFRQGQCAQTRLAKAAALIHLTADESAPEGPALDLPALDLPALDLPALDLYVGRSFAEYIWFWLEDAAREYGA